MKNIILYLYSTTSRLIAVFALLAAFLIQFASPSARAASLHWSANGTTLGGSNTWDDSSLRWGATASGPFSSAWNNANNDTAIFGGTVGLVTLGGGITNGGIQFNTTGYIITNVGNTLIFGAADNTITLNNVAAATINGPVGGSGNVTLTAANPAIAGTLNLAGATTGGWSGTTTIGAGMTLTLGGAVTNNQSLLNTTGITLNGGTISSGVLKNDANGVADRINDGANWTVNSGSLIWGSSNAGGTYAETNGTVTLNRGQMNFRLNGNLSSGSQTLTLGTNGVGLVQNGSAVVTFGNNATALNSSVASGNDVIRVSGITASTLANQIIGPWAVVGTEAGNVFSDFAKYTSDGTHGYVVAAGLADTAETNWVDSTTDAWSLNPGTNISLTATRQAAAVKFYGASATLNLTNFNLQTYGLFFSGANAMSIAATDTGALTTPTGGGNLFITCGQQNHTISAPINDNGGAVTNVVSGAGRTLTLSSTNSTYSGGTVLNSGTLATTADSNLGSGGGITVNGAVTWSAGPVVATYNRSLTINEGAVLSLASGNAGKTNSGVLSGNGAIINTASTVFYFLNTGNTFTGPVNNGYEMQFGSLGDSSNPINLIGSNSRFTWTGGTKTFASRPFTLQAAGTGFIDHNGTGALVIQQDLAIAGAAGARTLQLEGTNGGANVFSGNIANGTNGGVSVVSLTKADGGTWTLTGTNTYSGATTLNAGSGLLVIQGQPALSSNSTVTLTQNSSPASHLSLKMDGAGTISLPNTLNINHQNAVLGINVTVGNNGSGTGNTIAFKKLNVTGLNNSQGRIGIGSINGNNGYRLQFDNFDLPAFNFSTLLTWTFALQGNSAPVTLAGTIRQLSGTTGTNTQSVLELNSLTNGNLVTGNIMDAVDYPGNASTKSLRVTVNPSYTSRPSTGGEWTLSGSNTFSGGLTLAGNFVGTQLNINSTNALGTGNFDISNGNNAKINNTSGGAIVNANNNAMSWANDFAFVGSNPLDLGTGAVTLGGNRGVTVSANTLTVGGVISGSGFGINKQGAGTLVLSGANIYSGTTTVSAGTLRVNGDSSAATNTVTVSTNATLGGTGTIGGSVTVNNGGNLAPGASAGTLTINSNLTISALVSGTTGKLRYELDALAGTSDKIAVGGTLTIGSDVLGFGDFVFTNLGGLQNGTYTLIASPNPISGTLDPTPGNLTGAVGSGSGTLQTNLSGTDIELLVTGVTGGPSAPSPTLLTNSVSGATLSLSWPASQGWRLQEQTNSRSVGLRTNWVYVTDTSVSSTNITVDKTKPTTFYRLVYP